MNAIFDLPMELRLAALFFIGLAAGSGINWAIYSLAWHSQLISPWQRRDPKAPPRRWFDFVPVFGWLTLRREAAIHGAGYWVRPLVMDLACGIGLAALYWWEISEHLAPPIGGVARATPTMLHLQFLSHAILLAFMLVATFIDFDEQTIPDGVTIPGTLLGLLLAALWEVSHLPVVRVLPIMGAKAYGPLLATSTDAWPAWLDSWEGLALASLGYLAWCAALVPATATLRRGWIKGARFYLASIVRRSQWWPLLVIALAGLCVIGSVWLLGGTAWQALLTSITGLTFGGGLIWAVRIVGQISLGKEAMGFGDVTLMAMIGTFLGWQACLIIFFLSPFAALVIAASQWLLTRRRDIAFGPYLCLAALIVILKWAAIWDFAGPIFALGWLVPAIVTVCLLLMMGLLMTWRIIERLIFGDGESPAGVKGDG